MKKSTALLVILLISMGGLAFSGYLSYGELFGHCSSGCRAIGPRTFGVPACVLGFVMYLSIVIVSALGLSRRDAQ